MLYLSRALKGHKEQEYLPPPVGLAWLLTTSENTGGQFKCEETGAINVRNLDLSDSSLVLCHRDTVKDTRDIYLFRFVFMA